MKLFYTFFTGLVLGGTIVLVALERSGRLMPPAADPRQQVRIVVPPGEETHEGADAPKSVENVSAGESAQGGLVAPVAAGRLMIPVLGVGPEQIRDTFDEARGGGSRRHEAIDIMAPRGTEVVAASDGVIRKLFLSRAGGITIYHENPSGELMFYYAHLDGYARGLREGTRVARGDVIGYVGSSGNAQSDAPHLHFAVFRLPPTREWWKGDPINPYPMLTSAPPALDAALR